MFNNKSRLARAVMAVGTTVALAACSGSSATQAPASQAPASQAASSQAASSQAPASQAPASQAASSQATGKTYRVAYIARAQSDSFAAWLANSIKAEAAKYPDINLTVQDGQAKDDVENGLIENAIANKFDLIIVQANNAPAQLPYLQKVIDAGIPLIVTNPRVEGLTGTFSTIDANPYDQGSGPAKLAFTQIPQNAEVVVLRGPAGNYHGDQRRVAWKEQFFDKRPDIKIVAEDTANWNKDEALTLMEDWIIAHPKIQAVIGMNDNMALGAIEAVKGKDQYKSMLAYGVDGTAEAVLAIKAGTFTATALQSALDLAKLNMQAAHDVLTGVKQKEDNFVPAPVITKDNADQYIQMYKDAGIITK